jgi:hypothetical protein
MKMPGFSAEASVCQMRGRYGCSVTNSYNKRGREVVSQLKRSVFRRFTGGGVFRTIEDYWICKQACESAYSACLATCEGTVGSPIGSTHCTICDQDHQACLQGCSRDIA